MNIEYKLWTRESMKDRELRYFIKYKGEEEKEVSLDEYVRIANENDPGFGVFKDHVPKVFIGKTASGYIDPEVLEKEGCIN